MRAIPVDHPRCRGTWKKAFSAHGLAISSLISTLGLWCLIAPESAAQEQARSQESSDSRADPLARAREYADQGSYEAAAREYSKILGIAEQQFGADSADLSSLLNEIGVCYFKLGEIETAETFLRRAVDNGSRAEVVDQERQATLLNNLAALYQRQEQLQKAEPLYLEARGILRSLLGPEHQRTLFLESELGILYLKMGRTDEGIAALETFLEAAGRGGWGEPLDMAERWEDLGRVYRRNGQNEKGLEASREAVRILHSALAPEHPRVIAGLSGLAVVLAESERFEEAEELFRQVLELQEKSFGSGHLSVGMTLGNLAGLRSQQGRREEALTLARQSSTNLLVNCGSSRKEAICERAFERHGRLLEALGVGDEQGLEPASPPPQPTRATVEEKPKHLDTVYRAQVRSVKRLADAEAEVKQLVEKLSSALEESKPAIEQVELPGKGTWYRVQFGEFTDAASAQRLCDRLLENGLEGCWVAKARRGAS